jgi:hypothetical protein
MISGASRVDPIAAAGERVAIFTKDAIREAYQIVALSISPKEKRVSRLPCEFQPEFSKPGRPPSSITRLPSIRPHKRC